MAIYCDPKCQKDHWQTHKPACKKTDQDNGTNNEVIIVPNQIQDRAVDDDQLFEDQKILFGIIRNSVLNLPFRLDVFSSIVPQEIAKIEHALLIKGMKKVRELYERKTGRSVSERCKLQKEITRLGLDLLGPQRFFTIINAVLRYEWDKNPSLIGKSEVLSLELQRLYFPPSEPSQAKELSLFFCWDGPNQSSGQVYKEVVLSYGNKDKISAPVIVHEGYIAGFEKNGTLITKLSLRTQEIKALQCRVVSQNRNQVVKVMVPNKLAGQSYCLQVSMEGAEIVELKEFFERKCLVTAIEGLLHQIFINMNAEYTSDMLKAHFFLTVQKAIQAIELEKIHEILSAMAELAAEVNCDAQKLVDSKAQEIASLYVNLLGQKEIINILRRGAHLFFLQGKKLTIPEEISVNKIALRIYTGFFHKK